MFFFRAYGGCAGTGGFAAQVQYMRAFGQEGAGAARGLLRGQALAAVGEGIRGDVNDPGHQKGFRAQVSAVGQSPDQVGHSANPV